MKNYCKTCNGSGKVSKSPWWFWNKNRCPDCGGDGYQKPPGWPDRAKMDMFKPKPPII